MSFSQQDLNINPIRDNDTILMVSSQNDSLILFGYRKMMNLIIMENYPSSDEFALYGCRGQWYHWQQNFSGLNNRNIENLWIDIDLRLPVLFESCWNEKSIYFSVEIHNDSTGNFIGKFKFGNDSILPSSCPKGNEVIEGYFDNITIGQRTFSNVYKFYSDPSNDTQNKYHNWIQIVYYSISEGVVGLSLKNGEFYYKGERPPFYTLPNKPAADHVGLRDSKQAEYK
jgi:hypothetical protein